MVDGKTIEPKFPTQPMLKGEVCYGFWQGGDVIRMDNPLGHQALRRLNACISEGVKAVEGCIEETGPVELCPAIFKNTRPGSVSCGFGFERYRQVC